MKYDPQLKTMPSMTLNRVEAIPALPGDLSALYSYKGWVDETV